MSEKISTPILGHEHIRDEEHKHELQQKAQEATLEQAAKEAHHERQEEIGAIRKEVQEKARSGAEIRPQEEKDTTHTPSQTFVNKELKEMAYRRTLNRVRRQMSLPGRLASRIIHHPIMNAVSEVTAKTVGRPSGLLGGGILALTGTSSYYYMTKHYGYNYNFFIFVLLLLGGFVLGWLVEIVWRLIGNARKHN
jgi:flagellar biosynthesis GTPase FlhF